MYCVNSHFNLICFGHPHFRISVVDGQINGGQNVQPGLHSEGHSPDVNELQGMQYAGSALQHQSPQYQPIGHYPNYVQNSQSTYEPSTNMNSQNQYNPSFPYGTTQNRAAYGVQEQQMGQNQYPYGLRGQTYPYNQRVGLQYDQPTNQNQTEMFQSGMYGNQPNMYGQNGNGYITENGQQRQATQQDLEKVDLFKKYINEFMTQMGDWHNTMFKAIPFNQGPSFPNFANMPRVPQAPCLCSPENCGSVQQNSVYDATNQYIEQRNAYQQNGTP
ncbi:unnamed protein product [Angiostrongylus costaricensis]|uniref:Pepsin-I3 domain-containing protein n=1 Tax=Angiostrongylus costaricensis TaxID=334426 RepID=A0A0R3PX66_ANGCS|nr:unnamed protein product [Angiostrongylus costaricensis]